MEAPARDPQVSSSKDVAELHLLISEMGDELSSYRRREAVWLSIVFHVLVFLALIFVPKWIPKGAIIVPVSLPNKDTTFLQAPPDQQQVKPPKTNIISDKDRRAQSPTPQVNKELLRKLLDAQKAGAPAPKPPAPAAQTAQQTPAPPAPQQQTGSQNPPPAPQTQQTAQLQAPQQGKGNFSPFKTGATPGIQQALQSLANNHGTTHVTFGGDYGAGLHPNTDMRGDVEILSDTMGVDFGPYLQRALYRIKMNWYNLIPEVARPPIMKRGSLILHFAILKDGRVSGLAIERPSSDLALDRAAYGGVTASDPFDRLPPEFGGTYLALRIKFIYNSKGDDLE